MNYRRHFSTKTGPNKAARSYINELTEIGEKATFLMMDDDGISFETPKIGGLMRLLRKRLPILEWGPQYDRTMGVADLVAGITLGLTLVPQSIAYASLANLPVQYGLYSAYIGTMLYMVMGTVKEVSIGPTSLMALLTLQLCRGLPLEFVILLTFLAGCIVLCMGLLRLGFLVDLISPSVTSGFTSGTAVIIVISQLKGILGLSFVAESVVDNIYYIKEKWGAVRIPDVVLGLICCTVLLVLRKLKDIPLSPKRQVLQKTLWLLSIGRNALVVLSASLAAFLLHNPQDPMFKLSGRVEPGVPKIALPPFSVEMNNRTLGFIEMAQELGSGLLMMPIVMVLANIAIAKAFSQGGRVDATQEMLTLGLCNILGSMLHAMPTCGAFTRSAVSHSSGVRSPAAGFYSGIITLLALIFLTQYFYFIPKACLSSVLICAVIFMVDFSILKRLWRRDRTELGILLLTFIVSLLKTVESAVAVGVLANLAALIKGVMRPKVTLASIKSAPGSVCTVRPSLCLCYLNAELVSRRVLTAAAACPSSAVLLDCKLLPLVDYSATQVLARLVKKLELTHQKLIVFRAPQSIIKRLESVEGLETRAFTAYSPSAALAAVQDTKPADETPLLLRDENV